MSALPWVGRADRLRLEAGRVARWCGIALGFSAITSTALSGVLMAVLLLAWLASGDWTEKVRRIRGNEAALAALGLLLLGILGALWSQGAHEDVLLFSNKYSKLLLIPVLVSVLIDPQDRQRGLAAMAIGLLLSLLLSYALALGLLPSRWPLTGDLTIPSALKNYISHGIFMAYGVLLFSVFAWQAAAPGGRWLWGTLGALAAANVFIVPARTAYLVLAALAVVALFHAWRWRGFAVATVLVAAAFAAAFALSPAFKHRLSLAATEFEQWRPNVENATSIGLRLNWYENTVKIIRDHPVLGVGTGGFPKVYHDRVGDTEGLATRNPHNQYLLTTAELGLVGLGALMLLFYCHVRVSTRLDRPDRVLANGLLALMLVGCLFNSFLLDHNEGVFFCWLSGLLLAGATPRPAR